MVFAKWLKNTSQKANHFFGRVKGYTREGVNFLNTRLLPAAKTAHRTLTNAASEISKDQNLSEKNRARLSKLSSLADVGIQKLQDTTDTINRVKAAV